MKLLGNILWLLFVGIEGALIWLVLGILWCITIIGIPFGKQCFKFAKLSFFPFGKRVKAKFSKHIIANILWLVFGGFELAIFYLVMGLLFCITIIGIPFGKQCFKLASLSLSPFGTNVK